MTFRVDGVSASYPQRRRSYATVITAWESWDPPVPVVCSIAHSYPLLTPADRRAHFYMKNCDLGLATALTLCRRCCRRSSEPAKMQALVAAVSPYITAPSQASVGNLVTRIWRHEQYVVVLKHDSYSGLRVVRVNGK